MASTLGGGDNLFGTSMRVQFDYNFTEGDKEELN